jgi:hypothetical protein
LPLNRRVRRAARRPAIGHRARVHLQRPGATIAADLGEKDLEIRPIRYGRALFRHEGKVEVGRIEQIDPADWESSGVVPTVLVVQRW